MKYATRLMIATLSLAFTTLVAGAEDKHEKIVAGPNGGRMITAIEPHFEFLVTPERTLKITFFDADGKAIAPAKQVIKAIGGDRSKPTRFTFTTEKDALVSDKPLPEGQRIPIILQLKVSPESKTVNEKFTIDLSSCSGCEYLEYACTCNH